MDDTLRSPNRPHTTACTCAICRSVHQARDALIAVPIEELSNSPAEREAANFLIEAERLLATAENLVQRYHILERYNQYRAIDSPTGPFHQNQPPRVGTIGDGRPARKDCSPTKQSFEEIVKARAAELGILKSGACHPATPTSAIATSTQFDDVSASPQKTKFLVCDHCRSHGLRCNEASVCKECILREMPCTHRICELSDSKDACPRTVCFYVHKDWMPDVYGQHNPDDENWLALPGKLREHLAYGQLGKLPSKSEKEILHCYQGVAARQLGTKQALFELVDSGAASWETASMACRCQEIEAEENRARAVEDRLRRLTVSREAGGA